MKNEKIYIYLAQPESKNSNRDAPAPTVNYNTTINHYYKEPVSVNKIQSELQLDNRKKRIFKTTRNTIQIILRICWYIERGQNILDMYEFIQSNYPIIIDIITFWLKVIQSYHMSS